MVLFWGRMKQAQLRALSNQFKRCYFQIHGTSSVIHETRYGVVNTPALTFHRVGPELSNSVRFFAAPVQAKPKYEENYTGRPRMNEQISAEYVRIVTDEGHGVVSRYEALERARRLNVDLVEVQADGNPPVCKLMDYNKEIYIRHAKEKEQLKKKKSELALRKGTMKEVRITPKITNNDLQTKADAVKRLAERGYRIKCMAVRTAVSPGTPTTADQDLGGLLSRFSALIDEFSLVESGPIIEARQAYVVIRHVKFGFKKGPGKKKVLQMSTGDASMDSPETLEQSIDESGSETEEDVYPEEAVEFEAESSYDSDISKNKTHEFTSKFTPETSNLESENRYAATRQTNASAPGSENRYASTRRANASAPGVGRRFEPAGQNRISSRQFDLNRMDPNNAASSSSGSSYGMFGTRKPNSEPQRDNGPVEVNRYKKGPNSQPPPSDQYKGARGDFRRDNSNINPGSSREKQAGFRR